MNSKERENSSGSEPSSNLSSTGLCDIPSTDNMKRAAAARLIERYYYQLKEGCGRSDCTNEFCLSSGKTKLYTPNEAAAEAINLFARKAPLCEQQPSKLARLPSQERRSTRSLTPSLTDQYQITLPSTSTSEASEIAVISTNPILVKQDICEPMQSSPKHQDKADGDILGAVAKDKNFAEGTISRSQSNTSVAGAIHFLTETRVLNLISECEKDGNYVKLVREFSTVFCSPESLSRSFLVGSSVQPKSVNDFVDASDKEMIRSLDREENKDEIFQEAADVVMASVGENKPAAQEYEEITVDLASLRRAYAALAKLPNQPLLNPMTNQLLIISENCQMDLKYHRVHETNPDYINIFVIIFELPFLDGLEFLERALLEFCDAVALLPLDCQARLAKSYLAKCTPEHISKLVRIVHQVITLRVISSNFLPDACLNEDKKLASATKVMRILFYASLLAGQFDPPDSIVNDSAVALPSVSDLSDDLFGDFRDTKEKDKVARQDPLGQLLGVRLLTCRQPLIPFDSFYNEPLSDQIEMDRDFAHFKASEPTNGNGGSSEDKFSFMHYPFILTPATKSLGLYYDNRIRMYSERRMSMFHSVFQGAPSNPYLKLRVRRDHLIDDALVELEMVAMENPNDLKKQLVVEFEGEQGIDEGGVSKEFFQLIIEELFNPDFGMFIFKSETQNYWFNPITFENNAQFTLIGIVLGLAIYNNVILDVHFPPVLYSKLLGKKGTFDDLAEFDPSLWQGLKELLAYEEDNVDDTFLLTFSVSYNDMYGHTLCHDLKPGGSTLPVTKCNRRDYVDAYSDFLLNSSVDEQFRAFRRGFQTVTDESPLRSLFRPEEVELLVCGNKNFDFQMLEESTEYDGGYDKNAPIICNFWAVVHSWTLEQKRKLLQFATGSDRIPVGGLAKLKLIIARHGPDSNRLPTAHTCFNVLLLPEYSTKEKLEERLLKAITYSKGFGML